MSALARVIARRGGWRASAEKRKELKAKYAGVDNSKLSDEEIRRAGPRGGIWQSGIRDPGGIAVDTAVYAAGATWDAFNRRDTTCGKDACRVRSY